MNNLNGVLLLDKPAGITSNRALQRVKRLFNTTSKVGHTGSLDPLATGMLPICFGEATKFSGFLLNSDKKYIVTMQIGIKTDTGDLDGSVVASESTNQIFTELEVQSVLKEFIGNISQVPPIYSAIKQNGVPLYKLARLAKKQSQKLDDNANPVEKINITPLPRTIKINSIKLYEICNLKKQITLEVNCSKGTYIRTLVEDIAAKLNCLATVISLRRIEVGNFMAIDMISMEELERRVETINNEEIFNQLLLPVKVCLASLPILEINQIDATLLQHGKHIHIDNLNSKFSVNTLICLVNTKDSELLGVGEVMDADGLAVKRLVRL